MPPRWPAAGLDEPLCIDLDATLITAHADDKDGAAVTYKKGWGFHPLLAYLDRGDGLGESLAGQLRPGNAGSNTATDHIDVSEAALDQLGELPDEVRLLVRADTAGCTHDFLSYLRCAGVGFSVGYALTEAVKTAIRALDEAAWTPALTQDDQLREGAAVAELTDAVELSGWPAGARVLVRREPLHPGAQQTLEGPSHCSFGFWWAQNSSGWGRGTLIRRPFRRPVRTRTASRSPRFTVV